MFRLTLVNIGVPGAGLMGPNWAVGLGGCQLSVHVSSPPSSRPQDTFHTEFVSAPQNWLVRANVLPGSEVVSSRAARPASEWLRGILCIQFPMSAATRTRSFLSKSRHESLPRTSFAWSTFARGVRALNVEACGEVGASAGGEATAGSVEDGHVDGRGDSQPPPLVRGVSPTESSAALRSMNTLAAPRATGEKCVSRSPATTSVRRAVPDCVPLVGGAAPAVALRPVAQLLTVVGQSQCDSQVGRRLLIKMKRTKCPPHHSHYA
jgi:hypothetical protein